MAFAQLTCERLMYTSASCIDSHPSPVQSSRMAVASRLCRPEHVVTRALQTSACAMPTQRRRAPQAACQAAPSASPDSVIAEEGDYCIPPEISVDNAEHSDFSLITIEVRHGGGVQAIGMPFVGRTLTLFHMALSQW